MVPSLISHIGIAVSDLNAAVQLYRTFLGVSPTSFREVPDQKVGVAIFDTPESGTSPGGRIELLQATSDDSPIAQFIARRGEGLHHVCLCVDDIESKLSELERIGIRLIDKVPRIGADGHRIAFVHPSDTHGVLIELEER